VPSFLEAQTRSKLSRAQSDMRALLVGLACYASDHNRLPSNDASEPILGQAALSRVTSPIAYISTVPHDVFFAGENSSAGDPKLPVYAYMDMTQLHRLGLVEVDEIWEEGFYLASRGPDGDFDADDISDGELLSDAAVYDPLNGTVSGGDLFLSFQGITGGHILQNTDTGDTDADD